MICAGTREQIIWTEGIWVFVDIGFSNTARSCGILIGDGEPKCLKFGDVKSQINSTVGSFDPINLVIEAPLSVAFDAYGNPTGRSIERERNGARYWYVGPGCAVMVAAMYLVREIASGPDDRTIRLFEGFVSYKLGKRSNHREDVTALRHIVRDPARFATAIIDGDRLARNRSDRICSAFRVLGVDCGIPAVIKPPGMSA